MKLMEDILQPSITDKLRTILTLHGLGGIGKTQLSVAFARKYQNEYTAVFWLNGQSRDSLKRSILGIAKRLPKEQFSSPVEIQTLQEGEVDIAVQEVLKWFRLAGNKKWLLIYDNVDRDNSSAFNDPQAFDIAQYIPQGDQGSIVITTRQANLGNLGEELKVTTMEPEESLEVLRTRMSGVGFGESHHKRTLNNISQQERRESIVNASDRSQTLQTQKY